MADHPTPSSRPACSCGHPVAKHSVVLGLAVCPSVAHKAKQTIKSYNLQLVVCLLLTLALPSLVGHLNDWDVERSSDGLFLQPLWNWVLHTFPDAAGHVLFSSVLACLTFFVSCLYFSWKDLARHESKIQKDWWPTINDMLVAGVPQMVIYIVLNGISWVLIKHRIALPSTAPSLWELSRDFVIMLVVGDYYIYFWHRTMHQNVFFRDHIHSVHHQYKKVFSWAGGWVHPLEDLGAVLTQVACPIWFLHPHPLSFWVFVSFWTLCLVDEHSGHDVWWSPYKLLPFSTGGGGAPHDIHHYKPHTNFGFVFNLWDIIFMTMQCVTDWYPGKTDHEPYIGGKDFKPVNGVVPVEGWSKYNKAKKAY